jgi:hypothetical protein
MMLQQAYAATLAMGIALNNISSSSAFSFSHQSMTRTPAVSSTAQFSAVVEKTETETNAMSEMPTAWECNEDAECVVVPACDEVDCRTSLDVRIHGKWYDLSGQFKLKM